MPGLRHPIPGDLSRYSEATRRLLYDLVVATTFHRAPGDPPEAELPGYTAEEASLSVHYFHGRWFATWQRLEVPATRPESEKVELLRILPSSETPWGFVLREC